MLGEPKGELERLPLGVADRFGAQILRAREEVKALECKSRRPDSSENGRDVVDVDSELLRPPAHLHAGAFELEVGLTRTATRAGAPRDELMASSSCTSRSDSTLTSTPAATAWRSSDAALAGPAKLTSACRRAGVERDLQLTGRRDVDPVDPIDHEADKGRERVRLHRVVQFHRLRQRQPQLSDAPCEKSAVVRVERGAADALGQA
jgi:hypothetical protein